VSHQNETAVAAHPQKIVVIGASAAGLKAACRARRLLPDAEVSVIEAGEYISYAACGLPYFLLGDIDSFDELRKTTYDSIKDPDYFGSVKDIRVQTHVRAVRIDRDERVVTGEAVPGGEEKRFPYDNLVIATGAEPFVPPVPGHDLPGVLTFTKAEDAIALKKDCSTGQISSVALIGAGFIGLELCEAFTALWGIDVTLFEAEDQVLPGLLDREFAVNVEAMLQKEGVDVVTGARCTAVILEGGKLSVQTPDGAHEKVFDRVIFCVGLKPNTGIARDAGIKTGKTGGIVVNEFLQTSDPAVYAGGDCIEIKHRITQEPVHLPLGSLANRQGRTIGDNLAGRKQRFAPATGSTVLKVFDWNVAAVGLNARKAAGAGFPAGEVWGTFEDKAHYYPETEEISVKLIFDRKTEKILGMQAVGKGDVVRRADVISALMQKDAALRDVFDFESAYAPPYAGPLDPLHFLAYIADSILRHDIRIVPPDALESAQDDAVVVVDVRNDAERAAFPVPEGAYKQMTIPIEQLRNAIGTLPPDRAIMVVCQRGPRSYEAVRALSEHGYRNASFLGGGMLFARI